MPDLGEDLLSEITALDGGDGSFTDLALGQMVLSALSSHKKSPCRCSPEELLYLPAVKA